MSKRKFTLSKLNNFTHDQLLLLVSRLYEEITGDTQTSLADDSCAVPHFKVEWSSVAISEHLQRGHAIPQSNILVWTKDHQLTKAISQQAGSVSAGIIEFSDAREIAGFISADNHRNEHVVLLMDVRSLLPQDIDLNLSVGDYLAELTQLIGDLRFALNALDSRPMDLLVVTQNAIRLDSKIAQDIAPLHATLHGLCKGINHEFASLRATSIDLSTGSHEEMQWLLQLGTGPERQLRLSGDSVSFPQVQTCAHAKDERPGCDAKISWGSCLIVGGLGGIGREIVGNLLQQGASRVHVIGRSDYDESLLKVEYDDRIFYSAVDVTDMPGLRRLHRELNQAGCEINHIFHLAGLVHESLFINGQPAKDFEVLNPKISGAINLLRVFEDPSIKHLYFSSITSVLGTYGASSYAAANEFLDQLARTRPGQMAAINWGPWENVGMTEKSTLTASAFWSVIGIRPLKSIEALQSVLLVSAEMTPQTIVASIDWQQLHAQCGERLGESLLSSKTQIFL